MGKGGNEHIILGESTLKQLHENLPEKLRAAYGNPVMLTVSYIDGPDHDRQLHHWMVIANDFPPDDVFPTLIKYGNMAKADIMPKNQAAVQGVREQLRDKKLEAAQKAGKG